MAEIIRDEDAKKENQTIWLIVRTALKLLAVLLLVIAVHLVISSGYDFGYNLFAAPAMSAPPGREVTFQIEKGDLTAKIIDGLADAGLIPDKFTFRCQILFYDKILQPGEYTLNTSMTSKEILLYLNDGPGSQENK
ncbi:MAG: hypothetical protein Q4F21_02120 [Lachnospiraceae bacterium]|nr:hypothetical protein [Lachnospiraceae bacterium]